jgi:hypothetical protein
MTGTNTPHLLMKGTQSAPLPPYLKEEVEEEEEEEEIVP